MGAIRSWRSPELAELKGSNELLVLAGGGGVEVEGVGSRSKIAKLAKVAPADTDVVPEVVLAVAEVVVLVEPQSPNGSNEVCAGCEGGGGCDGAGCEGGGGG